MDRAVRFGLDLAGLFAIVAAASVIFGLICIAAVKSPRWGMRKPKQA